MIIMRKFLITLLTAVIAVASYAQMRGKHSTFYDQRASLFEFLPVDSTNIVFLGNSITNGCEWHELLGMPNVVNRGISGDIVEGIEDRLAPIVNGHPEKIFMMIGVNDVSHNLTADSIATATIRLIEHIRSASPQTRLYVQSLLPVNSHFDRFANVKDKGDVIRDVNTLVKPAAEALGAQWIDLYPFFCDSEGELSPEYTNDGLHLMGSGYLLWRSLILPYLNQ